MTLLLLSLWAWHAACSRMADNSTGDVHAPRSQLSITDLIVISVYLALNVAVGIWVRTCGIWVRTCGGPLGSQAELGLANPWVSVWVLFGGLLPKH